MRGIVSKEEAKRLSQPEKYRQKDVVEQKEEEEGTKMDIEPKIGRKRNIVSFFGGG